MKGKQTAEELLKNAALLVTQQRVGLLSVLQHAKHPLSAEAIASKLKGKMNITTVYRGLDQLSDARIVRRIELGKNHALYELATAHHHHIVCRNCGLIENVDACIPSSVGTAVLKGTNKFSTIEDHALEFFGVCMPCTRKK